MASTSNRQGVKRSRPKRGWIDPLLEQASPRPWEACPDMIAVLHCPPGGGQSWPRSWAIDAGWAPGQP
eukprot:5889150-Pyramimonas_sp.AAC.1